MPTTIKLTRAETIAALAAIDAPQALTAAIEYELEDEGLITTDDGPYATLTAKGRARLERPTTPRMGMWPGRDDGDELEVAR